MSQHVKSTQMFYSSPPKPWTVATAAKPHMPFDNFTMQYQREAQKLASGTDPSASARPWGGAKATMTGDSYLQNEIKKNRENMQPKRRAIQLKPHVGADAMMFDFARKQAGPPGSNRNQFSAPGLFGYARPHVPVDNFATAHLRVTKSTNPNSTRLFGAGGSARPHVGADSFHMQFLNSIKGWSKNKAHGQEVRL